jgi:hypothetical protein
MFFARPVRRRRTPPVAESRTSFTSIVLAILLASVVVAQVPATRPAPAPAASAVPERAVASITIQKLDARRLRFLTNDLLEGRVVGHRGNQIAEIFLASEFERLGVKGIDVSKDGPYYQPFEMVGSTRAPGNRLVIREGPAGQETASTYEIGPDLSPMNFSPIKEASGDLVFAGYGITAPKIGYDDYQGIDATGKIVIVLDGAGKLGLTDVSPASKVAAAQAHGAVGVLAVPPLRAALDGNRVWPEVASPKVNRFSLPQRADNATIPVANISVKLAEQLLGEGRSVPGLMRALDEKRAPGSFDLPGKRATLAVNLTRRRVAVRNLIALMEGTDPKLKNELVVVGAHFDANGIDEKGLIYTGADDNGSGATAVVAIAEAFAKAAESGLRPRRTVIFALWNAEEKGRGGSTYYVGHPVPASGTVVVNVNLDHVGRNEENVDQSDPRFVGFPLMTSQQNANVLHLLGYSYCPDVAKVVMEENRTIGLDVREDYDQHVSNLVQRSDHWSFLSQGIPAVFLHTGLHPDYHLPTDTIEKINVPKFAKIARLAFRVTWRLATQAERPQPPRVKTATD